MYFSGLIKYNYICWNLDAALEANPEHTVAAAAAHEHISSIQRHKPGNAMRRQVTLGVETM